MSAKDPRIDAYIARSAAFARPVLKYIRKTVHKGCPDVEETIKWGMPHIMHKGMLAGMAAFKSHCAFGFWKGTLLMGKRSAADKRDEAMGQFGCITSIADLPSEKTLLALVKRAAALNERGVKVPRRKPAAKGEPLVPAYFMAALRKSKRALAAFRGFNPSHRREYVEWVTEAKQEATRARRIATAIEWMAEGKSRSWKYVRT